jgi:transposase-like protein
MTEGHLPPFYCPYCGEEDIRPFGERHGDWVCGACRRAWTLRSLRPGPTADPAQPGSATRPAGANAEAAR